MVASVVAGIVGFDLSERLPDAAYDPVIGGSGIVATICAIMALPWSRWWASVPLVLAAAVAVLMAYARLGPPDPGSIDATPVILPPILFVLGGLAAITHHEAAPTDEAR